MKAIRFHQHGGAEVLQWEEVELPPLGPQDVRLRQTAVGVNFIDVYQRTGLYPRPLPSGLGSEAAGVIEAVGKRVRGFKAGDRVGYISSGDPGAYAEQRVLAASELIKLPRAISDELAAAVLLKGLTSWFLLRETFRLKRGDTALVTAAAGGVGLILIQWARALGAKVIGVVGSEEKAELARRHGCRQIIVGYGNIAAEARRMTRNRGVDVAYDGVGKDTFFGCLDSLRARGMMVTFGNASGAVPPIEPLTLTQKGSLFLTRPTLVNYAQTREELEWRAGEVLRWVTEKKLNLHIGHTYPLAEAAQAHRDLEGRKTTGKLLLIP